MAEMKPCPFCGGEAEAENKELRTENAWLKSCINCKIRKECPRHCGKVVHDCDHWEYGDNTPTVDAVEVVHGRWLQNGEFAMCSECTELFKEREVTVFRYCPECGAKMDGDGNG